MGKVDFIILFLLINNFMIFIFCNSNDNKVLLIIVFLYLLYTILFIDKKYC